MIRTIGILLLCSILVLLVFGFSQTSLESPKDFKVERFHVLEDEYVRNGTFGLRGLNLGGNFKKRERILPLVQGSGITWHRSVLFWYRVESQNDKFDFSEYDKLYDQLKKYDIEILFTLRCVSPWGAKKSELAAKVGGKSGITSKVSHMPDRMEDYIDFVTKTVSHFKGRIRFWQIENEPTSPKKWSFWGGTGEELAELTRAAYRTIKRVDPQARVLLSGLTTRSLVKRGVEWKFINTMFEKGVGDCFDIFDIHSYRRPQRVFKSVAGAKTVLGHYGYTGQKGKPMWMTETSTPGAEPLFPLYEQANDVIKRCSLAFAVGISRVFWWNALDGGRAPIGSKREKHKYFGLVTVDLKPKPAWHAFKLMTHKLRGFRKIEKLAAGTGKFLFRYSWDDGSWLYVAWSEKRTEELSLGIGRVMITDINGKEVMQDSLRILLTEAPIFVERAPKARKGTTKQK